MAVIYKLKRRGESARGDKAISLPRIYLEMRQDKKAKNESSYSDCVDGRMEGEGQRRVFSLTSA